MMVLSKDQDFTPATCAQPMLWGTRESQGTPVEKRPRKQGISNMT